MRNKILLFTVLVLTLASWPARAGGFELSLGVSYNRSTYTAGNYNWTRRLGGSIAYQFSGTSEVEFAMQDVLDRTKIDGYEDTTFHDRVYSVNWVQYLVGRSFPIQPYFKLGVGQLNRDASGQYAGGASPARTVDAVTGVLGGGLRLYVTRGFAIRFEVTSYLEGARIGTWKDNQGATLGASIAF